MDLLTSIGGGTGLILVTAASAYRKARLARRPAPAPPRTGGRTINPADYGLVPRTGLIVQGNEITPEVAAALEAARVGDWRPAAGYLGRRGTDWDLAWTRLGPFHDLVLEDDRWLQAWRQEQPDNADAALLHADGLVGVAWQIRSSKLAPEVSREQFEGFHRVLREAEQAAYEAIQLAPTHDPNPYVVLIAAAMGLNWPNDRFRALWSEIASRAPQHWRAHDRALQYWCQKWHGSHELMHGFIDNAIATAPAGSLLPMLKLEAFREQFTRDDEPMTAWQRPEVTAALDTALADLAAADPAHPRLMAARGWLAYGLTRNGRGAEATEQYRALGNMVTWPWSGFNDPVGSFVGMRADAVLAMLEAQAAGAGSHAAS
ncbi:DUF4034 domain-containing protein [Actinacidiphila oryziradicis]|uniref:DUF4034 domain-containing protein n=1 Tax=Actinacidiphila oryziradicis TaxID=2571141 RepID=A0A4U0S2H5_9ACTN|nr:DUF4034 domain-containing protein [Actinacidiphila oryziradicis]TKA03066.1 DUF4034 domain-containing protein [Actinacidiphila oryziradicis]